MLDRAKPYIGLGALLTMATSAVALAGTGAFKNQVDANSDGALSLDEFVVAMADRDFGRFDVNKDDRLTVAEWTTTGGQFQSMTAERFNTNGDDEMSSAELVEMYSWIFSNRDSNKDGRLDVSEAPPFLLASQG